MTLNTTLVARHRARVATGRGALSLESLAAFHAVGTTTQGSSCCVGQPEIEEEPQQYLVSLSNTTLKAKRKLYALRWMYFHEHYDKLNHNSH